jgi:hypothetical protein
MLAEKPRGHNAERRTMGHMGSVAIAERAAASRRLATPLAGGAALAGAAGYLAGHDPAVPGGWFPACPFHQATGLWCPGCGLTRGMYQLLHGHVATAIGYNVFTPLAMLLIVGAWWGWLRQSTGRPPPRVPPIAGRWVAIVMPTLILGYGVLRNLPVAPLRALAP